MNTIALDDEQLELCRRETMKVAAQDLRNLANELEKLAIISPWPVFPVNTDIQNTRTIALESLGTLDALGWPPKDRD